MYGLGDGYLGFRATRRAQVGDQSCYEFRGRTRPVGRPLYATRCQKRRRLVVRGQGVQIAPSAEVCVFANGSSAYRKHSADCEYSTRGVSVFVSFVVGCGRSRGVTGTRSSAWKPSLKRGESPRRELESVCGGNSTVGSNPTATAIDFGARNVFLRAPKHVLMLGVWQVRRGMRRDGSHRHRR